MLKTGRTRNRSEIAAQIYAAPGAVFVPLSVDFAEPSWPGPPKFAPD